ncbi:MAG: hypothetical protein JHC33_05480 [Ignisphaera sp.]|nr:hypothetical protein [Ignisphaera sp.]
MVWLSKREIAYYIILKKTFGNNPFNLGEALDVLAFFGSKRVARKVIKNLIKKGFLKKIDAFDYRIEDLENALNNILFEYIRQRAYKTMKSRGFKVAQNEKGEILIYCLNEVKLRALELFKEYNIILLNC